MNCNIENRVLILSFFAVIVSFIAGYNYNSHHTNKQVQEVIEVNNATFKAIKVVFNLMADNTDTMMRFAHYTDQHMREVPFCPECTGSADADVADVADAVDDTVTASLPQLLEDSKEFKDTFKRIAGSLSNQRFTLNSTLEDLKYVLPVNKSIN